MDKRVLLFNRFPLETKIRNKHTALIFYFIFAGKPFPQSSVNHNDVNIVENSKLNVAISFQSLFFGRRID